MKFRNLKIDDHFLVTDYVANGSFASLKENVTYLDNPGYAILLRLTDFTKNWNDNYVYVSKDSYDFLKKSSVVPGDLIISNVGEPGQAFIAPDLGMPMTLGPNTILVRPKTEEVNNEYFSYLIKSPLGQRVIQKICSATTLKKFNKTSFRALELPFPNLTDQIKIALLLENVETLIKKREENMRLLDEVLNSSFLESFGDKLTSNLIQLDKVCTKITDGTHDTPKRLKNGVKFITGKHIRPFVIDYENSDYVDQNDHEEIYRRCNPTYGDILYTNIGANIGTAAMNSVSYEFSMKNVALLKPKFNVIKSRYLEHVLNNEYIKKRIIQKTAGGGAQSFISLKGIRNIEIPLPDFSKQEKFADLVESAEKIRPNLKKSLRELENLFDSISQRAFKGELDLENLSIDHIIPQSKGGSDDFENLDVLTKEDNIRKADKIPEEWEAYKKAHREHEEPQELSPVEYFAWQDENERDWMTLSIEELADWIRKDFDGFHFTSEILINYLLQERNVKLPKGQPLYYSSEEIKKKGLKLDRQKDLKVLLFEWLGENAAFLELEQVFYDQEKENFQLELRKQDYEFLQSNGIRDRSGVYLKVKA